MILQKYICMMFVSCAGYSVRKTGCKRCQQRDKRLHQKYASKLSDPTVGDLYPNRPHLSQRATSPTAGGSFRGREREAAAVSKTALLQPRGTGPGPVDPATMNSAERTGIPRLPVFKRHVSPPWRTCIFHSIWMNRQNFPVFCVNNFSQNYAASGSCCWIRNILFHILFEVLVNRLERWLMALRSTRSIIHESIHLPSLKDVDMHFLHA